jgi:LPS sulfotransferase NodH
MLEGNLDRFDVDRIEGWVRDVGNDARLIVRISVNGKSYQVSADLDRSDLARKFGDGSNFGFSFDLLPKLQIGTNHVEIAVDDSTFAFSPATRSFELGRAGTEFRSRFLADRDVFRFPSDLEVEVSAQIPVHSEQGGAALRAVCANTKLIFVLFSNRTGSNLVTDILEQSGFGHGATNEPFLANTIISTAKELRLSGLDHYLAETIREWRKNEICFLKISWDALFWLISEGILGEMLPQAIFIWTKRRDKVAQAISYVKAVRTGSFFERASESADRSKPGWAQLWNGDQTLFNIGREVHNAFVAEERIGYFLTLFGRTFLEIYFEDLVSDLPAAFERIRGYVLENLALPHDRFASAPIYQPNLLKQSSAEDDGVRQVFLKSFSYES